ncbi:vacuolar protein 8 isoform X3 [Asparagus officinalis]|uniref:vacuolar protein 8 isoform X1 n=1 Tax=Asparagus officinalis TaxID=4686 RepID=UPI00098E7D71|nr:vacuolar protein 8 isoform X1 [Asparagus officinalis]XP_020256435.1 vacuolar protein 8 isoform X2 [Asparagus officinalis]XP_020256436.1 vacuolar protein 8 isoform X3 [Asparagus officinalis]
MKEEEEEGDSSLQQASALIDALISSSYSVPSFAGKWQSIREKLGKLNSGLSPVDTSSKGIPELDILLQSLIATVNQTQLLSDDCSNESYRGGKLRLRSDLDMIIAKLNLHIKHLDEIYASGILTRSRAIILSKPGAAATREDMRLYAKDLFSRLRIGGLELRVRALAELNDILSVDEKYVKIVATEVDDGISILITLLELVDLGIQEEALEAVLMIAGFESYRGNLAICGIIGPLVRLLESGSELGKLRAGKILQRMTHNSDNSWSVSGQGGVNTLLKICSSVNSSKELVVLACGILRNISVVVEIKRFMVDEGAISVFANLVSSKEEAIQIQAIEFLAYLAYEDEAIKQKLIRERVIESLVHVLDPNSSYSSKTREVVLRAIESCCFSSTNVVNILMSSGYVNKLLFFLRNGEISIQESALKATSKLSGVSEEARRVMGDLGFMPELVKLLDTKSFEVREMAAESLCNLISIQKNRKKFVQEDHNVSKILQLLNPEEEKPVATKKLLLSALLALTESNSCRRKIVASGYIKNVEKLAENDVFEAKKIMKKLSTNRFRSILNGIWST